MSLFSSWCLLFVLLPGHEDEIDDLGDGQPDDEVGRGVVSEHDWNQHEAPNKKSNAEQNPEEQQEADLFFCADDQEYIGQCVPGQETVERDELLLPNRANLLLEGLGQLSQLFPDIFGRRAVGLAQTVVQKVRVEVFPRGYEAHRDDEEGDGEDEEEDPDNHGAGLKASFATATRVDDRHDVICVPTTAALLLCWLACKVLRFELREKERKL